MIYTNIIYGLFFPNNKIYIGQTNNFNKRMSDYKNLNETIGKFVKNAITKYGWNNVKKEILFTTSSEFVDELETQMIAEYKSADKRFGYNILEIGGSPKGYKHSKESKKKMSIIHLGKKGYWEGKKRPEFSEENHPFYGIKRLNVSKKLTGRKLSESHIINNSKSHYKSVNCYKDNRFIKTFESVTQAGSILNINKSNISSVLTGKLKSAGGYIFKYDNGKMI